MERLKNPTYTQDLDALCGLGIDWSELSQRTVVVSGATGMIGTVLIDVLMRQNDARGLRCQVVALGRDVWRAERRLPYFDREDFRFEEADVSIPGMQLECHPDIVFHLASNTHPRAYATQPINTITSNVIGTSNLMENLSCGGHFVLASSVEVYGQSRGDVELFGEQYCGYIDSNTLRAGYPEAKRLCEALCQAYAAERGIRVSVPRLPRTYGPTLLRSDTKALSQFLHRGVAGEDIVLKSAGKQYYSYLYVFDVVAGMLWATFKGQSGLAYNLADARSDVTLSDLARLVADLCGVGVVFELPDEEEKAGYSTAAKAALDPTRIHALGWRAKYGLREGLKRTLAVLHGDED